GRRLQHFYLVPLSAFSAEVRRPTTNDNCLQQLFHRTCTISLAKLPSKIPSGTTLLLRRWLTFPIIPAEFLRTVYRYNRADLVRILRLTTRQLAAWEKAGLVAAAESYSFFDLLQIKKVRDLCARKVRPAVIRQSLDAMLKQVAGMENPLLEAGAYTAGHHRVAFRHNGKLVEPIAGELMFDVHSRVRDFTAPKSSISHRH